MITTDKVATSNSRGSVIRRYAANMALMVAGLAVAVLLIEILLRLLGISYPRYAVFDEYTGVKLRPGLEWWWRGEGKTFIRINSRGLRDREHRLEKPPNTLRIAILGDSYAAAFQVAVDKTFWAVMEQQMNHCASISNRTVEVINFGVGGYGTGRELLTLRHRVWDYSPDIVLLAVVTGNDLANNSRTIEGDPQAPYFVHQGGKLVLDDSFRYSHFFRVRQTFVARLYYDLYNRFRLLQVFNNAREVLSSKEAVNGPVGPPGTEVGLNNEIYSEPADPIWREAWQITEELITVMRDEVAAKRARFLAVTLSNGIQVHPDAAVRQTFMKHLGVSDLFYPDLRLQELGRRQNIPMLNLAPDLQRYAEDHKIYLHGFGANLGFGHWNEDGHRVAGQMIAQKLCSEIAVD